MGNPYYANPFPIYQPAMRIVENITNSNPASVTTTFAHQYITGTIVRIDTIPVFGMEQINQQVGTISVTGSTTFNIDIDTTHYDTFLSFGSWPSRAMTFPQVVPIGEVNSILTAATTNVLPY